MMDLQQTQYLCRLIDIVVIERTAAAVLNREGHPFGRFLLQLIGSQFLLDQTGDGLQTNDGIRMRWN